MSDDVWTVGRLLTWTSDWLATRGSETPRLDAEVLLAHVRGCPRIALYTAFETPVDEAQRGRFRGLVKRRGEGEPVAYLVGNREFFSLPLRVSSAVLVPRPETEDLVVRVIDICRDSAAPRIADVGTGSGAIVVALAKHLPRATFLATDISPQALEVARENAARHGCAERIEFVVCDLLDAPAFMLLVPAVLTAQMIPITPGGLGVRESAAVTLLPAAGLAPHEAILVSLASFAASLVWSAVGGVVFVLLKEHKHHR